MKKLMTVVVAVIMICLFSGTALAQGSMTWRGGGGWERGTPYARMYNLQTVETVSGEVVSVDKMTPMRGMADGVHLMVKTDKETISVHLGPSWYIENQDVEIAPTDKIEVKGSRITFEGKPAIIAAEVVKGDKVLMLRDASGIPAWSARPRMTWRGGGGWERGTPYARMYNLQTVETVSGEVVSVDKMTPMRGMADGVHLMVKTDKETISVHLGPSWYIENQDAEIAPTDKIEVKGSRITFEGKPAIIAAEVEKGDKVLMLRDASGIPAWSGWRRR